MKEYQIGDIVEMSKKHPCGSFRWEILRIGMDIKIKCCKCDRIVMLPRNQFEKRSKKIIVDNKV